MNTKITKIENKETNITDLVTTTALNTKVAKIENEIPYITNLATKAALNTKAIEIENKIANTSTFVATPEFHELTKISFDAKMKKADSVYFFCKSHFEDDGMQNYLVFQTVFKHFKMPTNSGMVIQWKSKCFSEERLNLLLHQIIVLIYD